MSLLDAIAATLRHMTDDAAGISLAVCGDGDEFAVTVSDGEGWWETVRFAPGARDSPNAATIEAAAEQLGLSVARDTHEPPASDEVLAATVTFDPAGPGAGTTAGQQRRVFVPTETSARLARRRPHELAVFCVGGQWFLTGTTTAPHVPPDIRPSIVGPSTVVVAAVDTEPQTE